MEAGNGSTEAQKVTFKNRNEAGELEGAGAFKVLLPAVPFPKTSS